MLSKANEIYNILGPLYCLKKAKIAERLVSARSFDQKFS
jgi:hypothetical protein